jgi:hypothetical protein
VYPDPYKIITDPDPDPGGPETYEFYESESVTLGIRKGSTASGNLWICLSNQFSNSRYAGVFCTMANKPNNFNL